jgi:hypothetical protein
MLIKLDISLKFEYFHEFQLSYFIVIQKILTVAI